MLIPSVDRGNCPDGLQSFLLDGHPSLPYHPPWSRLFMQASRLLHWTPTQGCADCGRSIMFKANLPVNCDRPADPYEVVLCVDCGRVQIAFWVPPALHRTETPGCAWETLPVPILALKRAVRDRLAEREASGWDG
jgi:hypothetical protein